MNVSLYRPAPCVLVLACLSPSQSAAQRCHGVNAARAGFVAGGFGLAELGTFVIRHDDWWSTPSTRFHVSWDQSPSLGQDRLLHAAVGYHLSQVSALAWEWACVSPTTAGWLGALVGTAAGLPKELGDGLHEGAGFSLPDFLSTAGGAMLPALHRAWPASRPLHLKLWYWPSSEYRNRTSAPPRLESDYAGQRYFLALRPGALADGAGRWPDWLGIALGHSVTQWISGPAAHEWYVVLDLNARHLPIDAGWWRTFASFLDQIHFPLPGLRMRSGRLKVGFW